MKKTILLLGLVIFISGLLVFSYLGIFNRYYADDWCYNADLKRLGLVGTLGGYTYITQYASNRYSLTLFSGLSYPLEIAGVIMMTPLMILLWFIGLFWILYHVNKISSFTLNTYQLALLSAIIIYFTLYLAPHLYQSIYWRSGLLPYSAPIIFSLLLLGLILQQGKSDKIHYPSLGLIALAAFIAGGFSEAGNAYITALLGIYILIAAYGNHKKQLWAKRTLPSAIVALLFALLGMAVLIAAPTSHIRMGRYGEPATPLQLVKLVFTFSTKFFRFSLTDFPLPHLVLIAMCGTLAYILHIPTKNKIPFKVYIILLCLIALITLTLIAAALSPSAYIEQGIPAKRARIIPRFIMIMGLAIGAWLSGYFLRQHYSKRWFYWLAVVIVGFSYIYALRTIVITADKVAIYRERAIIWDERDEIIRAASANGISEIDVRGIDGLPVGGIRDFKPKPGNWINGCASSYYGLKEIRATLP